MSGCDNSTIRVVESLKELLKEEADVKGGSENVDLTAFFTSAIKGLSLLYNYVTGDAKNFLEFTHLANYLIVQDLLESGTEEKKG